MEKKTLITIVLLGIFYWLIQSSSYTDNETQVTLKYHIKYPKGGSGSDTLPLIIALHGNGDTYDNFYEYTLKDFPSTVRVALIEAPKKYWPYDIGGLESYSTAIASLSRYLKIKYLTSDEPILLGYSGGGVMAYFSALTQCKNYSKIVPISGKLQSNILPKNITTDNSCSVLAFHGKSDSVVGYSGGLFAIDLLKKYSSNVKFISFEEGHHGVFKEQKQMILSKVSEIL